MKLSITLLLMALLATGCARFSTGAPDSERTASTAQQDPNNVRERNVQFGNWRVGCVYEEATTLTQCKAETYRLITGFRGEDTSHPAPILWISWLKGEP